MVQGILMIAVFLGFSVLMFRQKIPSFLALLLMAVVLPLVAGAPLYGEDGVLAIVNTGSYRLASSIPALFFGAWVGEIMNERGVTKDIIRRASELAGDRPIIVAIVMYVVVAVLFTSLTGLGAHIMVAMLVLPILTAVGIKPLTASCLLLMARSTGLVFNMSQWTLYMAVTNLDVDPIRKFAMIVAIVGLVVGLSFVIFELKIKKATSWAAPVNIVGLKSEEKVPLLALLTPFVPFVFVIGLDWDIIPALLVTALYCGVITSWRSNLLAVLSKTIHEALKVCAPSTVLFIMVGIILNSVGNPYVSEKLLLICDPILPTTALAFFLFFAIGAPLCMYRGPMNMWGMGSGVLGLLVASGRVAPIALCAGFLSIHFMQLSTDPTNTQNVWTADYFGIEVNQLTKRILPPTWAAAIISAAIATFIYFIQ